MSWELADTEQNSTGLTLRYIITKPDSSTSEATILFSADNLVLEANLLSGNVSLLKANPTPNKQPEVSIVRVPIHRHNGLPIVIVIIDGQPCNMFFDTGAPGVILNSKYFDHNISGQVMGSGGRGAVGTGSVSGVHHVKSMDMFGVTLHETDIMTSDLSNLETIGVTVHGILGDSAAKPGHLAPMAAERGLQLPNGERHKERPPVDLRLPSWRCTRCACFRQWSTKQPALQRLATTASDHC